MKKILKKIGFGLALAGVALTAACGGGTAALDPEDLNFVQRGENGLELIRTAENLTFYSSDGAFAEFLNDFYSRHIRSGKNSIGIAKMGACWSYAKEWEALALSWFDSSALALKEYDADALMRRYLNNIDIDKFGNAYVWFNDENFGPYEKPYNMPGQGWVFPNYMDSLDGLDIYGSEFNESADEWTADGRAGQISKGYLNALQFRGEPDETLKLESGAISFDASLSPFVEISLALEDLGISAGMRNSEIADYAFEWKTEDGTWHSVRQSEFASNPKEISQFTKFRTYFPMYLHPDWTGTVTAVRVSVLPEEGKSLAVNAQLDYFRCAADTRQSTSTAKYILTLEEMASFANDIELIENNIGRARQALMFQLYALDGVNGLIDLSYLQGHDSGAGPGHRIGNGWADIYPPCNLNFEANMYFRESLLALARMEETLAAAGIETETTTVANYDPYGKFAGEPTGTPDYEEIEWSLSAQDLRELADTVRTNMQKNVGDGGFWNPVTGRFAWGIYDANSIGGNEGEALDYGMVEINIRSVYHDIATAEQAESIYSWLDGTRTVSGDTSTGEDIYFYEFAPRTTTKDNKYDYCSRYGDKPFSILIQDGGAAMHLSYYDLVSRHKLRGADDSYARFSEISDWYHEVMAAGGEGTGFYQTYYLQKMLDAGMDGQYYTLQGGGSDGAMGLDNEFYEAATLYAAVPAAYFGLDAGYNTLMLAPDLPSQLDYLAMTNLKFADHKYDCLIMQNRVIVSGIEGDVSGLSLQISLKKPEKAFKVLVNGRETSDYREENGKIVLRIPFANADVEIA